MKLCIYYFASQSWNQHHSHSLEEDTDVLSNETNLLPGLVMQDYNNPCYFGVWGTSNTSSRPVWATHQTQDKQAWVIQQDSVSNF